MALVAAFAPLPAQVAVLGACVSILAGLFIAFIEQSERLEKRRAELLEKLEVPVALAPEHDLFDQYKAFADALSQLATQTDPVLREFASVKLSSVTKDVQALASGTVVFAATETWRTVYEDLLLSPGIDEYQSVSWVKTADYWQDAPGRRSMRANFQFMECGGNVERIVVVRASVWHAEDTLPVEPVLAWVREQHDLGVRLSLIRETDVSDEADIISDFGIYGERAVGVQELDDQSRTIRFVLSFDAESVRLARDRYDRLRLFAVSFGDLLERASGEP